MCIRDRDSGIQTGDERTVEDNNRVANTLESIFEVVELKCSLEKKEEKQKKTIAKRRFTLYMAAKNCERKIVRSIRH